MIPGGGQCGWGSARGSGPSCDIAAGGMECRINTLPRAKHGEL